MSIVIGADQKGKALKDTILDFLKENGIEVIDLTPEGAKDFYEASIAVTKEVLKNPQENKGIIVDEMGVGPFMVADKFKYIICAELNDEHSAKMTRDHNNSNIITLGSGIVGSKVACQIAKRFCMAKYSGGRHQIRVDMLNEMC